MARKMFYVGVAHSNSKEITFDHKATRREPPQQNMALSYTHIRNLPHILQHGLITSASSQADPNFVRIGDTSLIDYRKNLPAPEAVGGQLSDYVPFYLGPRSPMLYQIATGWEAVKRVPQQDIIYLISSCEAIQARNLPFFFSDGHVRSETSTKYTRAEDFDQLDWDTIYATHWKSDETDLRRKEKKQAEFLVKHQVPVDCIEYILPLLRMR